MREPSRQVEARARRGLQAGDRVCVTGASGFIGSHVVGELLRRGCRVRGTVRDPDDGAKTAHLRALADELGADDRLELVAADLMRADDLVAAVADCPYVAHVASSVRLRARDPQREIVDVAVRGTTHLLDAIERAGCAHRVVITSSIAAVVDDLKPAEFVHDESCWNESSTVRDGPYPLSKTLAERAAWDRVASLPPERRFGLCTINPALVLGPVLAPVHKRSSPTLICDLMTGKYPLVPKFHFGVVDVRDVALAHVLALENGDADGRHILCNRPASLMELARIAREAYPDRRTPRYAMPNPGMYVAALFDKRLSFSFLRRNLGIVRRLDNRRSRESLGITYRPVEDTVRDTAHSFVTLGLA